MQATPEANGGDCACHAVREVLLDPDLFGVLLPLLDCDAKRALRSVCRTLRIAVDAEVVEATSPEGGVDAASAQAAMARWPALRGLTLWCSSAGTLEALTTAGLTGLKRLDVFLASEEPWSVPALSATLAGTLTELGIAPQPAGAPLCVPTHEGDSTPTTTLEDINVVSTLTQLEVLRLNQVCVDEAHHAAFLAPLSGCPRLQKLWAVECGMSDLAPLSTCPQLLELNVTRSVSLESLEPLRACPRLRVLDIRDTFVSDISSLAACMELEELHAAGCDDLWSLAPLEACTRVRVLDINATPVACLLPLSAFSSLQSLDISGTNVESLAPLRACAQLTELHMSDCGVESLAPLEGCVQLQDLWMARCAAVDELAPLWRTTLRKLDLRGTRAARGLGLSPWDVDNRSYSVRGWDSDEEEEGGEEEGQAGAQEGGLARVGCNAHGLRATRHLAAFESVRAACPNLQDMVATQIEALVRELEFENGDELVLKEALRQVTLMARYGAPSHSLGAAIARAGAIPRLVALVWDRDTPSLELVEAAAGALWALADSGVEVLAAFGPAAVAGILPQIAKLLGMSRGDMRGTVSASLIDIVDAIGGTEPGATT